MARKHGVQARFTGYGTGSSTEGEPLVSMRFEVTTPGVNEGRPVTVHFTPQEFRQRCEYMLQLADQLEARQAKTKGDA